MTSHILKIILKIDSKKIPPLFINAHKYDILKF